MEILTFIVVIALFYWIRIIFKSGFDELSEQLKDVKKELAKMRFIAPDAESSQTPLQPKEQIIPPIPVVQEEIVDELRAEHKIVPDLVTYEEFKEEIPQTENIRSIEVEMEEKEEEDDVIYEPKPTFFERYPDIEKFIGENIINKIGITILVLGIAFFVKYAIDQNWINEIGRVSIGILTGGIIIGIAHRLQKQYKTFSSVLIGGGLTVLYFTIAIAFHTYHIFSQEVAFTIMVVITGFAVALTLAYNRLELAILTLIGGFATPFILSTGEGNYKVLFTYLLILNLGMMVVAFYKKWKLVNILSYIFTVLIYGVWLYREFYPGINGSYMGAFFFASAFYLLFFLMNILYNIKNKLQFKEFEIGLLISNTALYYGAGMYILHFYLDARYQGLFTALMGIFNLGFAYALYKKQDVDKNLVLLLIGMVLTFISLAAPVQLEGQYITLFWAAESVLLLWFSQKSQIKLIKGTSLLVGVLMLISLIMDWNNIYGVGYGNHIPIFMNKAFITGICSLVAIALSRMVLKNEKEDYFVIEYFTVAVYKTLLKGLFIIILFLTGILELVYQIGYYYKDNDITYLSASLYSLAFLTIVYLLYKRKKTWQMPVLFMIVSGIALLCFFNTNQAVINIRDRYIESHGVYGLFFMLHFILTGLFLYTIVIFNQSARIATKDESYNWLKWVSVIAFLYINSAELNHIILWISYGPGISIPNTNTQIFKTGYTVLWGLVSFILIRQGIQRKDKMLRIIALSLFSFTILKLFIWDLQGISEAGKIVAFIFLGILLLVVSFMYQKLKLLILDDKVHEKETIVKPIE